MNFINSDHHSFLVSDNFDVLCLNSDNNYYRKYSIQGPEHPRSYFYVHKMNNSEKIGFLGVDSCLEVGTKRPFNFVGQLTSVEMESIHSFLDESRSVNVNYLLWFGHYPTSTIKYPESERVRDLTSSFIQCLCVQAQDVVKHSPSEWDFMKSIKNL